MVSTAAVPTHTTYIDKRAYGDYRDFAEYLSLCQTKPSKFSRLLNRLRRGKK